MSLPLLRRARALRLFHDILNDEIRNRHMEELIAALEDQSTEVEALTRQEVQMRLAETILPNVVPLKRKPFSPKPRIFDGVFDRRFAINTPCLLEGQTAEERRKVALEIHSRTHRVAFLNYSDLHCPTDQNLIQLADCSLYIEELKDLSMEEQLRIQRVLEGEVHPLFISATHFTLAHLKNCEELDLDLVRALSVAHFRLQHPLSYYLEHGFFKLFLESLS